VSFLKGSRRIEVNYEHTPIHKTVGELWAEQRRPTPPPAANQPVNAKVPKPQKTPKAPKPPRPPKIPKEPKKRRAEGVAEGEPSLKRKRRKKDMAAKPQSVSPNGVAVPQEMASDQNCSSEGSAADTNPHSDLASPLLNLSAEEAARRRDVAIDLLSGSNINPGSLSSEQFNIFANQSPELQQESLKMLVKYGADRLRIVHPNKNGSGTDQPVPPEWQSADIAGKSTDAPGSKPKRSRKKSGAAVAQLDGAADSDIAAAAVTAATAKPKLTRGACKTCRSSKQKCDKAKPSCTPCVTRGVTCTYGLERKRASRAAKPGDEEIAQVEEQSILEQTTMTEPEPNIEPEDNEPDDLPSPGFYTEPAVLPPSQIIDPPVGVAPTFQSTGLYHHQVSGLSFPAGASPAIEETHDSHGYIASVNATAGAPLNSYSYPPPLTETNISYSEQPATTVQPMQQPGTGRQRSRRALPSGPPAPDRTAGLNGATAQTGSWQSMPNSPKMTPAVASNPSPRQQAKRAQPPTRNPAAAAYDDARQQSNWNATPVSAANEASYTSPSLPAAQVARAKSRQSIRNQSRTPVQNAPASRQPQAAQANQAHTGAASYPAASSVANSASVESYDYSQYSNNKTESTSNTVAYEPYSQQPTSTATSSYSSYGAYNSRSADGAATHSQASQTVASSYNATTATAPSTSHWLTANSSQSRTTQPFNHNTGSNGTSYNMGSSNATSQAQAQARAQALQGFSVRPQPPTQTKSVANAYGQQQQQSQRQQQQGFNTFSSQAQPSNSQQQNWYGYNAANNTSSTYNSSVGGSNAYPGASHSHGSNAGSRSYNQTQHQSMNLSSNTYSNLEGDQALYELLGRNAQH